MEAAILHLLGLSLGAPMGDLQNPKMEVRLYHIFGHILIYILEYVGGISPYIALKYSPYIW